MYTGISRVTRHLFPALRTALEQYLNACIEGTRPEDLRAFITSLGRQPVEAFVVHVRVSDMTPELFKITQTHGIIPCYRGPHGFYPVGTSGTPDFQWYSNEILMALERVP